MLKDTVQAGQYPPLPSPRGGGGLNLGPRRNSPTSFRLPKEGKGRTSQRSLYLFPSTLFPPTILPPPG